MIVILKVMKYNWHGVKFPNVLLMYFINKMHILFPLDIFIQLNYVINVRTSILLPKLLSPEKIKWYIIFIVFRNLLSKVTGENLKVIR